MSPNSYDDLHKDSFTFGKKSEEKVKSDKDHLVAKPKSGQEPQSLDDYVPESVGKVVDNVFGKLDNLVSDAADYLFGSKPKEDTPAPPIAPPSALPQQKQQITAPPPIEAKVQDLTKPKPAPKPAAKTSVPKTKQFPQIQSHQKTYIKPVMPESKSHIKGPVIARTTSISDLNLSLAILDDPDLARYFNQMKLYDAQVIPGGMCNMSQHEAIVLLQRGYWKDKFQINFENLKEIDPGIYPIEMAKARFLGMTPVYKACAWQYSSKDKLIKAIEEDINVFLSKGKESKHFHKYIYQVVQPRH